MDVIGQLYLQLPYTPGQRVGWGRRLKSAHSQSARCGSQPRAPAFFIRTVMYYTLVRRTAAGLSLRGFEPRQVHVGFVVHKVA